MPSAPRIYRSVTVLLALVIAMVLPATATAGEQLRGAQVHSLWPSSSIEQSERELDMLAGAGSNSVRIDISWSSLETDGKGQYTPSYVARADRVFQHAADLKLKVVAVLWSTPCWASSAPESLRQGCSGAWWDRDVDRYAPNQASDFGDAAQFVANRWGSKLAALEVWNEPNLEDQYSLHAPDPAATDAALLKAAYPRIKREAPELPVLAGALSGSDGDFLEKLYSNGIGNNFDGVSIHPYNEWRDPDDAWKDEWKRWSFLKGVPAIHQIMSQHGDGDKGVWLTEFGFSSCGQGDRWCVNEQQQAEYIKDSFRIARKWSYVKAALVYNLRNKGDDPSGREDQFGMLRSDFTPKPAWNSYREAMADNETDTVEPTPQVTLGSVVVTPSGIVKVPLSCAAAQEVCSSTATVVTRPVRQRKGQPKRRMRLGTRRVRIKPGHTKIANFALAPRQRRLLRRLKRVRARVTVSSHPRSGAARIASRRSVRTLHTAKLTAS